MAVFTIGFTKTSAANFFGRLTDAGVTSVVDVRLNRTSQLSGFAKERDLTFFLQEIGGIGYRAEPLFTPTPEMFADYRAKKIGWDGYEQRFMDLLAERRIEDAVDPTHLAGTCLLCSEDQPHHCHRRLVLEYLEDRWGTPLDVRHL